MFSPTFTGSSSLHRAHTYDLFRARRSSVFIIYQSAPLFHSMGAPSPLLRTRASRLIAPVMGPTAPSQPLPLGLSRCLSAPRPPCPRRRPSEDVAHQGFRPSPIRGSYCEPYDYTASSPPSTGFSRATVPSGRLQFAVCPSIRSSGKHGLPPYARSGRPRRPGGVH